MDDNYLFVIVAASIILGILIGYALLPNMNTNKWQDCDWPNCERCAHDYDYWLANPEVCRHD